MLSLITQHLHPRRTATVVAIAAFITAAAPAIAQACTVNSSGGSQIFKAFGDFSSYVLAPGGSFEDGSTGWTLNGASVQNGNESYHANSAGDGHSLAMTPTSSAVSPAFCIDSSTPTFRFFARQTGGGFAQMNVNLLWADASGMQHTTSAGSLFGTGLWVPTPSLSLGTSLLLWQRGTSLTVRLQFVPARYGASWAIDDVYIDPYSKG